MTSRAQTKVLLSLCLLLLCKAQHYQVQDNEEYTPFGSRTTQNNQQLESEGFVKPIDFTNLFAVNEDLTNDQSIPKDFFQSTSSSNNPFLLPLPSNVNSFSSDVELLPNAQHNNSAGFTHPEVKFQSLFDISGSSSEVGFRPQDFLKSEKNDKENDASSPSYEFQSFIPNFEKHGSYSPGSAAAPAYNTDGSPQINKQPQGTENHSYKPKYKEITPDKGLSPSKETSGKSNYQYVPEKNNYPGTSYLNALRSTDQKDKIYSSAPSTDHYSGTLSYNLPASSIIQGSKKSSPQTLSPNYSPVPSNSQKSVIPAKQENIYASVPTSDYYFGSNSYNLPSNVYQDKSANPNSPAAQNYVPATSRNFNQYSNPVQQISPSAYNQISSTITPNNLHRSQDQGSAHPSLLQVSPTYKPSGSYSAYQNEPYVKQASEGLQKSTQANKDKKCRKVDKHLTSDDIINGRFKRDAMTCYVCEDPKTKVNYEKCSYETEPQATNYFKGHTQSYKIDHAHAPESFRYRRDIHDIIYDIKKDFDTSANNFYPRRIRQDSGSSYEYPYSYTGSSYKYGPDYFKDFEELEKQSSASSVVPDEKNCKKVQKDSMTCYECVNPKTGGNYEQCSYSSDPKKSNYFVAHQTSYNSNNKKQPQEGSRHRRDEENKFSNHGDKQKEAASKNKESKSYEFPSLYTSSADDKSSEKSGRLDAYPNSKSDTYIYGNDKKPEESEKSDSYYYNSDKKPDGSDKSNSYYYNYEKKPEEGEKTYYYNNNDKKPDGSEKSDSYYYPSKSYDEYFRSLFPELDELNKASATSDAEKYDKSSNPDYYLPHTGDKKEQPEYKIKSDYYPPQPSEAKNVPDFETKSVIPPTFFTNNEEKKDLHKILGEFSNKDWSDCKKVLKDKMTCYQCTDKKGLQHEECMFVAASEPKSEHLAYHEVKEFRLVPTGKENQTADESKVTEFLSSPDSSPAQYDKTKRKTFFKKVTSTASPSADTKYLDSQKVQIIKEKAQSKGAPSVAVKVTRRSSQSISTTKTTMITTPKPLASNVRKLKVTKRRIPASDMLQSASEVEERQEESPKKSKSSTGELPTEPELSEYDRSPDGYYSAETRLKFDPILKVTLPEYMLSRSEHEAIFDEVMASGR